MRYLNDIETYLYYRNHENMHIYNYSSPYNYQLKAFIASIKPIYESYLIYN